MLRQYNSEDHGTHWGAWLAADFLSDREIQNDWDERLIQLCGGCAHQVRAFHSDWKGTTDSFREYYCPSCSSVCFRYSTAVVVESVASEWDKDDVREYCKARADISFWQGRIAADSSVDNPMGFMTETETGIAEMRRQSMIQAVEWTPRCPVCEKEAIGDNEFNFHHWDYQTDQGVQICADCHKYIHRGRTATEQAKLPTVNNWKTDAAMRIIDRAAGYGIITRTPQIRFNLPTEIYERIDLSTYE